ncbi:coatomer subunit alpha [Babesia caballi]|uniref:Coatomer subunit alpha n=1 Tax=Babesia caballi TaxID=5871 RepID=A0AAV4LPY4_BABCB|nr:coatomer subunit alpha [Babesia caballi]
MDKGSRLVPDNADDARDADGSYYYEVRCTHALAGHENGVNWAIFHPNGNRVITTSDDRTLRIWRYDSTYVWQTHVISGHTHNVCSLMLHPNTTRYLISVSEDKSIMVWDMKQWGVGHKFSLPKDRFWIIHSAPETNYLVAGHDSGFVAFKLFRERPVVALVGSTLYYVWQDTVYASNVEREVDSAAIATETPDPDRKARLARIRPDSESSSDEKIDSAGVYEYRSVKAHMRQTTIESQASMKTCHELCFWSPASTYCEKSRKKFFTLRGVQGSEQLLLRFMNMMTTSSYTKSKLGGYAKRIVPLQLQYNHYCRKKRVFLVSYSFKDSSFYEVFLSSHAFDDQMDKSGTCYLGEGTSACFASASSIVAINDMKKVVVHAFDGKGVSQLKVDMKVDKVFPVCANVVLLWSAWQNAVALFDVKSNNTLCSTKCCVDKLWNVAVSTSRKLIAAVFRKTLVIYDRQLNKVASLAFHDKIKTAAWYGNAAVIFATRDRLYYLMVNGDTGTLSFLSKPIYILQVKENILYVMQRNHRCYTMDIFSAEFMLKTALYNNDMAAAMELIESGSICGNAMTSYLIEKGYPELARLIVSDPQMRFEMTLKSGSIHEALEDARQLDDADVWKRLGHAALEQGNCTIAEIAFQKAKLFDKLSMLYLITGNTTKLEKMLNICKLRNDVPSTIQHALYLGDMGELANVLKGNNQPKLAEICKNTYGTDESAVGGEQEAAKYMVPLHTVKKKVGTDSNWPVVKVERTIHDASRYDEPEPEAAEEESGEEGAQTSLASPVNASVWGTIDDIGSMEPVDQAAGVAVGMGESSDRREKPCQSPLDFISLGKFEIAFDMLEKSFGLVERAPLEDVVRKALKDAQSFERDSSGIGSVGSKQSSKAKSPGDFNAFFTDKYVQRIMDTGYEHVTGGAFVDATAEFRKALRHCMLLVSDASRVYVNRCRGYVTAMLVEAERESLGDTDMVRSLELAAYFSCCSMLPQHRYLVLRRTMGIMWKAQNYNCAARIVSRLMAMDLSHIEGAEEEMTKARRIKELCEQRATDMYPLDYDAEDEVNLSICTVSLVKTKGQPTVHCRFCQAVALEKFASQKCNVCQLSRLAK